MSNQLQLAGAQSEKQPKFAPIFTSRFFSGIWTNRSPLRDATTSRLVEKWYGAAGDALITGSNIEITNKLTLARRPGTSVYDPKVYDAVDRFYEFRLFNSNTEEIIIMIDQANLIYSLYNGVRTAIFTKSAGAGQTYFQSVGNTLYFTDGIDNKKWQQTLFTWTALTPLGTGTTPFLSTFLVDPYGNIQQLLGTIIPVTGTIVSFPTSGPILTIQTSVGTLSSLLSVGDIVTFPASTTPSWLALQSVTVLSISSSTMTVTYPLSYEVAPGTTTTGVQAFAINGGTPTTGATVPIWNTTIPDQGNNYQGGYTDDGSVVWVNRGLTVENWGIDNSKPIPLNPTPNFIILLNGPGSPASLGNVETYAQITFGNLTGTTILGNIYILDTNGNVQFASSGTTGPDGVNPVWSTVLGGQTTDGSVTWTLVYLNAVSLYNGGWRYTVALVNSLDNTVSNAGPLSKPTGNSQSWASVQLAPGAGIDASQNIDPQSDYVAIFRTTDGQATPFLIPGVNGQTYTLPLSQYLQYGYADNTPDVDLNNLISAPIAGENTVPAPGAINLAYYLNRIWYSIGNTVYWTSGPDTPIGNGLNGTNPLDFDGVSSLVTRLVPSTSGLLVFTVSDVYIIQGNGTTNNPIQGAIPLLPGIGLQSYNALDNNGPTIGLFTTDHQFIILDPSSGTTHAGFPISDQLRLQNVSTPGQNWNPANVYVAWHVQGDDAAWYLCDGEYGWYRLMTTPAPETGYTWSPFATITGGVKAVQSIEIIPGVHRLLLGPTGVGEILERDLTVWSDNGTAYSAYATIGSIVLAQPGQVAEVAHIVTDSVAIGAPLNLGILVDECLPYYTGPIDILKEWVSDPPNLTPSTSLYSQRFYLSNSEEDEAAVMRHMQIQIIFNPYDVVQNELLTLTIFGAYSNEL